MTNRSMLVLVISTGGTFHDGLLALMTTIPCVSSVLVAQELEAGLKLAESHQPAIIIGDGTVHDFQEVIRSVKEVCSQACLIILVDDMDQKNQAGEMGADFALIRGFQAQELIDAIESAN